MDVDGSCYYVSDVQNLKYTIEALLQCGIRRSGILVGSGILHQMVQHFRETQCVNLTQYTNKFNNISTFHPDDRKKVCYPAMHGKQRDDVQPRQPRTRRRGPWGPGRHKANHLGLRFQSWRPECTRRSTYTLLDQYKFCKEAPKVFRKENRSGYELVLMMRMDFKVTKSLPFRCETPGISMNSLKRPKHYWCRAKS